MRCSTMLWLLRLGRHGKAWWTSRMTKHCITQLGRPDFAACKIRWKHIARCLNLASHFASSKSLLFNKGLACTNLHWNLYINFIAIHYVLHWILPYAEHVQHLKSGHLQNFWFYFEFYSQHSPLCYTWNMTNGFRATGEAGFCRLQNAVKTYYSMFKFSLTFRKQQNFNFQ